MNDAEKLVKTHHWFGCLDTKLLSHHSLEVPRKYESSSALLNLVLLLRQLIPPDPISTITRTRLCVCVCATAWSLWSRLNRATLAFTKKVCRSTSQGRVGGKAELQPQITPLSSALFVSHSGTFYKRLSLFSKSFFNHLQPLGTKKKNNWRKWRGKKKISQSLEMHWGLNLKLSFCSRWMQPKSLKRQPATTLLHSLVLAQTTWFLFFFFSKTKKKWSLYVKTILTVKWKHLYLNSRTSAGKQGYIFH